MKVTHVIGSLDPQTGGPPAVALRLAAAQAQQGHGVEIVCHDAGDARQRAEQSVQEVPGHEAVGLVFCNPIRGLRFRPWSATNPQLDAAIAHATFVHLHGVWDPILPQAARLARKHRRPYTLTPHGMLDPWSLSQKRLKKRLALALAYRKMINHAAFMHVLNDDEKNLMAPLGFTCPCHTVSNGVFLHEIDPRPAPGRFRAAYPALGQSPFVLFLSRLHFKKGLDYLADAFAQVVHDVPDVHLVVAGPEDGAGDDFRLRIAAAGLESQVHLVGPIYGRAKYEALVDAACFCLPSRQEGFSIAITEALACGLPVVISDACHFPEVAEVHAGRVVALDACAVAQALKEVLGDADLQQRMGEAGRRLVEERYTWDKVAHRLLEAYESATA